MAKVAKNLLILSILLLPISTFAQVQSRDTSSNAMIYSGVYSTNELKQKLANGDGNHTAKQLQQDFAAHGVSIKSIQSASVVNGYVTKGGRVIVADKTVATSAKTYGRTYMEGSSKEGTLYSRPASVSISQNKLPAFVFMDNGKFKFAIIKSCGNLTTATPVVVKTKTVQPAVVVVQTQTQAQTQAAPQPLPQTGMESAAALGLTGITSAAWYYRKSKVALTKAHQNSNID